MLRYTAQQCRSRLLVLAWNNINLFGTHGQPLFWHCVLSIRVNLGRCKFSRRNTSFEKNVKFCVCSSLQSYRVSTAFLEFDTERLTFGSGRRKYTQTAEMRQLPAQKNAARELQSQAVELS